MNSSGKNGIFSRFIWDGMLRQLLHSEIFSDIRIKQYHTAGYYSELFVMCPHADDFYCLDVIHHLIHKAVLDIDSPGASTGKVTNEFFIWWRHLIGIFCQDFEKPFGLRLQA